ncbi:PREDICTED: basic proline-rich protein-like, partial [Chinchilla lanigera]|uniref:basic proline-rich protein-like n=1 Tax=Chinchilla lanigera TaxID=34839 RepID=UPI0006989F8E
GREGRGPGRPGGGAASGEGPRRGRLAPRAQPELPRAGEHPAPLPAPPAVVPPAEREILAQLRRPPRPPLPEWSPGTPSAGFRLPGVRRDSPAKPSPTPHATTPHVPKSPHRLLQLILQRESTSPFTPSKNRCLVSQLKHFRGLLQVPGLPPGHLSHFPDADISYPRYLKNEILEVCVFIVNILNSIPI